MHTTTTSTVPAWTAFLALGEGERAAFLLAAGAYAAAAAVLRPTAATPAATPLPGPPPAPRRGSASAMPNTTPRRRAPARSGVPSAHASPAPLPALGGVALDLAPRSAFTDAAFIQRWQPGRLVRVYVASCPGLRALTRPLREHAHGVAIGGPLPLACKVGTADDIGARMAGLGQARYGSLCKDDPAHADSGFAAWTAEPLATAAAEPSPGSPVRVVGDGLEVTLPDRVTAVAFDQALARALAGSSLAGWARSSAGQAFCAARGVDPARLVRGTPGSGGSIAWSSEIVLMRPRHDARRLLCLCEQLVLELATAEPVGMPKPRRARQR